MYAMIIDRETPALLGNREREPARPRKPNHHGQSSYHETQVPQRVQKLVLDRVKRVRLVAMRKWHVRLCLAQKLAQRAPAGAQLVFEQPVRWRGCYDRSIASFVSADKIRLRFSQVRRAEQGFDPCAQGRFIGLSNRSRGED